MTRGALNARWCGVKRTPVSSAMALATSHWSMRPMESPSDRLARQIRAALGAYNDDDQPVQYLVRDLAARALAAYDRQQGGEG